MTTQAGAWQLRKAQLGRVDNARTYVVTDLGGSLDRVALALDNRGFDVTAPQFGADKTGVVDASAAIQAAVTALPATGGVIFFPAGTYKIGTAITNGGKANVQFVGAGRAATTLAPTSNAVDCFGLGQAGAEAGDYLRVSNLKIVGGNRALRLNNCLDCTFDRLVIVGPMVGIYTEGQNENHLFQNVRISSASLAGIDAGNANGGAGAVLDLPEIQKCLFDQLTIDHTTTGPAIRIGAGVINAVQQLSGFLQFTNVACLENSRGAFEITNAGNVTVQHYTGESNAFGNNGLYADFSVVAGATTGLVRLVDAQFLSTAGHRPNRYVVGAGGFLYLERIVVGSPTSAGAQTISYAGGFGAARDVVVPTSAQGVVVAGGSAGKVALSGIVDGAGAPVQTAQTITGEGQTIAGAFVQSSGMAIVQKAASLAAIQGSGGALANLVTVPANSHGRLNVLITNNDGTQSAHEIVPYLATAGGVAIGTALRAANGSAGLSYGASGLTVTAKSILVGTPTGVSVWIEYALWSPPGG